MKTTHILRGAALAITFAAAPLAFSPAQGITASEACAQKTPSGTGTCCYQEDAICVTPTGNIGHAFFKSEGRC